MTKEKITEELKYLQIDELELLKEKIDEELSNWYLIFSSGVKKKGTKCWVAKVDEKTHRILEFEKDHHYKTSYGNRYFSKEFWLGDGTYRAYGVESVGDGKDVYFKVDKCKVYLL